MGRVYSGVFRGGRVCGLVRLAGRFNFSIHMGEEKPMTAEPESSFIPFGRGT